MVNRISSGVHKCLEASPAGSYNKKLSFLSCCRSGVLYLNLGSPEIICNIKTVCVCVCVCVSGEKSHNCHQIIKGSVSQERLRSLLSTTDISGGPRLLIHDHLICFSFRRQGPTGTGRIPQTYVTLIYSDNSSESRN